MNYQYSLNEANIQHYRELAGKIAADSSGLFPEKSEESAYSSQANVAGLCHQVIAKAVPILIAVFDTASQNKEFEAALEKRMQSIEKGMEIYDIRECFLELSMYASKAATANGLPPCSYYGYAATQKEAAE
jgi:hypothetical protein